MIKLFISQPMRGLSDEEILETRNNIKLNAERILGEPIEVLDSFFEDFTPTGNIPVAFLGKSISLLAKADIVYFAKGWEQARGCRIEHLVAKEYEITIIEE